MKYHFEWRNFTLYTNKWIFIIITTKKASPVMTLLSYSKTCIKWTPYWVPKCLSYIYCEINLHSADTSVKPTPTPILSHFVAQNLDCSQPLFYIHPLVSSSLMILSAHSTIICKKIWENRWLWTVYTKPAISGHFKGFLLIVQRCQFKAK